MTGGRKKYTAWALLHNIVWSVGLLVSISACSSINTFQEVPAGETYRLLEKGKINVDRQALEAANERLTRFSSATEPVINPILSEHSGIVGEIRFDETVASSGRNQRRSVRSPRGNRHGNQARGRGHEIEFDFINARLADVLDFLFQDYIKEDLFIAESLRNNEVSWLMSGYFSLPELKTAITHFLDSNDGRMSRENGKFIVSSKGLGVPTDLFGNRISGHPLNTNPVKTGMWKLRYLEASQALPLIQPFLSGLAGAEILGDTNILAVTATLNEIQEIDHLLANSDQAAPTSRRGAAGVSGDRVSVEIEFINASMRSIIEFIFQEYLKAPYTILPSFADMQVSWLVSGEYNRQEILRMFEAFLSVHEVQIVQKEGVFVVAKGRMAQSSMAEPAVGHKTAIWKLKHLDPKQISTLIRSFVAKHDQVQVLDAISALIVTAAGSEIRQIDEFLHKIDISALEGKNVMVYSPKDVTPEALAALLGTLSQKVVQSQGSRTLIEAEVVRERNQVVIVYGDDGLREKILKFLGTVDRPDGGRRHLFYYTLRNQKATEVRQTLSSILPPLFGRDAVTVAAHDQTNSLLITAKPPVYYEIKKLLDRMDFSVPSVLIDAAIVEVQLTDEMRYGVEWFLDAYTDNVLADANINFSNSVSSGLQLGILSRTDNKFAVIDLLASETALKVLSRPRVIVANQRQATIETVDELKIISSVEASDVDQSSTTGFVRSFDTKKFGITLKVTPEIADNGAIDVDLELEDSRRGVDQVLAGETQPTFTTRRVNTEIRAHNGETIFIGGLIKHKLRDNISKIPILGDIPIIENFFSDTTEELERSELVVLLTAYIVFDRAAARLIRDAISDSTIMGLEEKEPQEQGNQRATTNFEEPPAPIGES